MSVYHQDSMVSDWKRWPTCSCCLWVHMGDRKLPTTQMVTQWLVWFYSSSDAVVQILQILITITYAWKADKPYTINRTVVGMLRTIISVYGSGTASTSDSHWVGSISSSVDDIRIICLVYSCVFLVACFGKNDVLVYCLLNQGNIWIHQHICFSCSLFD